MCLCHTSTTSEATPGCHTLLILELVRKESNSTQTIKWKTLNSMLSSSREVVSVFVTRQEMELSQVTVTRASARNRGVISLPYRHRWWWCSWGAEAIEQKLELELQSWFTLSPNGSIGWNEAYWIVFCMEGVRVVEVRSCVPLASFPYRGTAVGKWQKKVVSNDTSFNFFLEWSKLHILSRQEIEFCSRFAASGTRVLEFWLGNVLWDIIGVVQRCSRWHLCATGFR